MQLVLRTAWIKPYFSLKTYAGGLCDVTAKVTSENCQGRCRRSVWHILGKILWKTKDVGEGMLRKKTRIYSEAGLCFSQKNELGSNVCDLASHSHQAAPKQPLFGGKSELPILALRLAMVCKHLVLITVHLSGKMCCHSIP